MRENTAQEFSVQHIFHLVIVGIVGNALHFLSCFYIWATNAYRMFFIILWKHYGFQSIGFFYKFRYGIYYFFIACATTQIARQSQLDFIGRRFGIVLQKIEGSHHHARCTKPTLNGAFFNKLFLQQMQSFLCGNTFNCGDISAFISKGGRNATQYCFTINEDGASATATLRATLLCTC